jgi:hypothetical protein
MGSRVCARRLTPSPGDFSKGAQKLDNGGADPYRCAPSVTGSTLNAGFAYVGFGW